MKSIIVCICVLVLVMLYTGAFGETEITVSKGKVLAQTSVGDVTIDAGKKATLSSGQNPVVTVDDPMVDDLIEIYKWIEEEKEAKREHIYVTSIQVKSIESELFLRDAYLAEMPNVKSEPSDTVRIGLTSILDEPKYYDLEGNLLSFDLDKVNERQGYYYLHFREPIGPGEKFKVISVSKFNLSNKELWKEGALWNIRLGNCTPNCLNYFRIILPKSAIFVESSRPVTMIDNFEGRVAVTIRNYTGPEADGMYQISFLWPAKDGTTLADLPPKYRGLENRLNIDLAEEYRRQMEKILAGEIYDDLSTPLGALLTNNCALVRKGKELYLKSSYLLQKNPALAEKAAQMDNKTWDRLKHYFVDELDFLSTPPWPDEPENGHIHPIYMSEKGSSMRADTLACIYENGKWYRFGNMGNARDTDVSVFKKWITKSDSQSKTDKPTLDNLPWDNAGPEALDVYQEFIDNNVEYTGKWFVLGIKLVGGGYWQQAFDAFRRCESLHTNPESRQYLCSLIWQGHIYDLWDKRNEALQKYKAVLDVLDLYKDNMLNLDIEKYLLVRHDQWGIVLNYKWVKERLREPFTKEMIGK